MFLSRKRMPTASDMYFVNIKLVVEKELISSVSQLTASFCRPDTSLASKRGLDSKLCRHTLQKEQISSKLIFVVIQNMLVCHG